MDKIRSIYKIPVSDDLDLFFNYAINNTIAGVDIVSKQETAKLLMIEIMNVLLSELSTVVLDPEHNIDLHNLISKIVKLLNDFGVKVIDINVIVNFIKRLQIFYADYLIEHQLFGHNCNVIKFDLNSLDIAIS